MQNTRVRNLFSTILGAGVVAGGLVLSSCEDEFTEQDAIKAQQETLMALEAQNDSLNRVGAKINYTVTVIAAGQGSTTNGRTKAANLAEGASVTVVQAGKTHPGTAGKGGVATFTGLMRGQAVVTVEAADHTTVTYTTTLGSNGSQENNVGTLIPVFPLTVEAGASKVSGKVWVELDATNDEPEEAEGAIIQATINAETAIKNYLTSSKNSYGDVIYGAIQTATYDNFVRVDTVKEDGTYEIIIPNGNGIGVDGKGLSPTIQLLPFVRKQKYVELQDGKAVTVEKDVQFGEGITTDHIDPVPSVYAEIEAPTGKAEGFAVKAELVAQEDIDVGQISDGTGYKQGDVFELSADKDGKKGTITINSVDANDGNVIGYTYESNGAMYTEKPTVAAKTVTGTGVTFEVSNFKTMYNVVIDNPGTGYWVRPEVNMVYTNNMTGNTDVIKIFDGIFAGAIEDGQVGEKGEIIYENLSSTTVPTFGPVLNNKAKQATVKSISIDADGSITGVSFEEKGEGYLTSPKVMFKDASGNEVSATGVAVLDGISRIGSIEITNPGSGFAQNINKDEHEMLTDVSAESVSPELKPGTTNVGVNFYLGAGAVQ